MLDVTEDLVRIRSRLGSLWMPSIRSPGPCKGLGPWLPKIWYIRKTHKPSIMKPSARIGRATPIMNAGVWRPRRSPRKNTVELNVPKTESERGLVRKSPEATKRPGRSRSLKIQLIKHVLSRLHSASKMPGDQQTMRGITPLKTYHNYGSHREACFID
jgi:hypothetical protein